MPGSVNPGSGFVVGDALFSLRPVRVRLVPVIPVNNIWIASARCEAQDSLLGHERAEIEDLISIF